MVLVKENIDNKKYGSAECSYSTKFTWKIENFSTINVEGLSFYHISSDVFTGGGDHKWSILVYPKGGDSEDGYLKVFLDVPDYAVLPRNWTRHAKYRLSVISEIDELTASLEGEKTFSNHLGYLGNALFLSLKELHKVDRRFLVNDSLTVRAEVWFDGEKKEELKVKRPSSVAEFDTLFNIQNPPKKTIVQNPHKKIGADDRDIFKECLDMDMLTFARSGRAPELSYALRGLLHAKVFPSTMAGETVKLLSNFFQRWEKYVAANRDLSEALDNEDLVGGLKTTLKELSSKYLPVRNEAEAIDKEIAWYEKSSAEKKAKRARLGNTLDYLADQRIASNKALLCAEQELKKSAVKKEGANKTVTEFLSLWDSLKAINYEMNQAAKTGTVSPAMSATAGNYKR